ncbi:hypothetical protein CJU90_2486 [Yarrowia sp. C11]|nr:hypothetical protein CKK34_3934 [Yarrowia sp. E02]KAG5369043.1 hypothetical protein CJU90_2486 [Yarrowia sp. C11]
MAYRFFSQIVTEDDSEEESDDVGFIPRSENLSVEYDTCIDISSVVDIVGTEGESNDKDNDVEDEGDLVTGDIITGSVLNDMDDVSSTGDSSSVGGDEDLVLVEKDITTTIVSEVVKSRDIESESREDGAKSSNGTLSGSAGAIEGHMHSQKITVTRAPRLRPDMSDSEMSGISDESEIEVEVEVENMVGTEAPLTDVINGIVRERRKLAKLEARKRAKTHQKNKGYKIGKPHKKQEPNAKELEAIERQLEGEV